MSDEWRVNCLHHLSEASICLEQTGQDVLAVRLLAIIDELAPAPAAARAAETSIETDD